MDTSAQYADVWSGIYAQRSLKFAAISRQRRQTCVIDIHVGCSGTPAVSVWRDSSNSMRGTWVNISMRSSAGTFEIGEVTVGGGTTWGAAGARLGGDSTESGRCGSCEWNLVFTRRTLCVRRRKYRCVGLFLSSIWMCIEWIAVSVRSWADLTVRDSHRAQVINGKEL